MYYKKLEGKLCYLSPLNLDDAAIFTEWVNDPEIASNIELMHKIINEKKEKEILEQLSKNENQFAIVDVKSNRLIGECGLIQTDWIHRSAELGIFLGDKKFHGKGYGSEAISLLLTYCFHVLNLNNIMLRVFEYNKKAINFYQRSGFKEIGRRRKAKFIGGKYFDVIYMDILAEDFDSDIIRKLVD